MANLVIDIADAFKKQFGFYPPANYKIEPKQKGTIISSTEYNDLVIPAKPIEPTTGRLGGNYYQKDIYGREYYMPLNVGSVDLWFPVMSISMQKGIVETSLTERAGNVIEIINSEGLVINVKGLIVGLNNTFPEEEYSQLIALYAQDKSLSVTSVLTNIAFKAFADLQDEPKVVIKKVDISPRTGVKHVIPYEMNLISDLIFDLEVK